uniref:ABC transporter permease subunit n=1 Tax=Micromonospora carbonacea TaxID=47853 RepID=A0A7D6CG66_9ACTN|nr:ABC transporter permease subunit [Micromonospora carbonacea]
MKRWTSTVAVAAALTLGLAACSDPSADGPADTTVSWPAPTGRLDGVSLTIWAHADRDQRQEQPAAPHRRAVAAGDGAPAARHHRAAQRHPLRRPGHQPGGRGCLLQQGGLRRPRRNRPAEELRRDGRRGPPTQDQGVTPFYEMGADRWATQWWVQVQLADTAKSGLWERINTGQEKFTDPTVLGAIKKYRTLIDEGLFNADIRTATFDKQGTALLDGSLLIVVPTVFGVLLCGPMASWVLARRASRLTAVLYAIAISGIILPPAVVTVVLLLRQLGLAGTVVGMIGVYLGIYLSTVIFFVTGFVRTIPTSLDEAAQTDGAGPLTVFRRVVLPLLRPVLATATILICLYVWNDVFYAFFVIGGRLDTLPLNLFRVASAGLYLNNWHLIFAYVILMSLPLIAVLAVAQRKIISGITSGAVK